MFKVQTNKPNLVEVSKRAGVSLATASRALNGREGVARGTRLKVLEAAKALNYHPGVMGNGGMVVVKQPKRLKGEREGEKRGTIVGAVFPGLSDGFYVEVLKGLSGWAGEHGVHLIVAFGHGPADEMRLVQQEMQKHHLDGLIVMNVDLPRRFLEWLNEYELPVVVVDRPCMVSGIATVAMDNEGGACEAMLHLIEEHGYHDICVIGGPEDTFDSIKRLEGCKQAYAKMGLEWDESKVLAGDFSESGGYAAMYMYVKSLGWGNGKHWPEAVFALNDEMAVGAMACLKDLELDVPGDVAVIGFDDIWAARHMDMTTVMVPAYEMGQDAMQQLVEQVRGERGQDETQVVLPTKLKIRGTCGCKYVGGGRIRRVERRGAAYEGSLFTGQTNE